MTNDELLSWVFSNTTTNGECMEWNLHRKPKGYGHSTKLSKLGFSSMVHRSVWWMIHNENPGELQVMHSCDNPSCVNPAHLSLGTNEENCQDKVLKGRHPTKLTEDQVIEIRKLWYVVALQQRIIAEIFGTSQPHISYLLKRGWKHLPHPDLSG